MDNKNKRVLVVDDTELNIQIVAHILNNENYKLSFARSGIQALKLIFEKQFDLILLDIMMPGMDGYQVCRQIKAHPETRNIPVVFFTAKIDPESIVTAFEAGGVDYIIKPFNSKELVARVKTHIELREKSLLLENTLKKLEKKNNQITSSIVYAKNIQSAMLPGLKKMHGKFSDFFIFFCPRDIVSGDFYWFKEIEDKTFVAVVDCTGHGVPGAFMSMIGTTLLNEIVIAKQIFSPAAILTKLHESIVYSLNQSDDETQSDGMEVTIAMIEKNKKEVTIASSGQTFIVVSKDEVKKYRGDYLFIGSNFLKEKSVEFTEQKMNYNNDSLFYFFTDGFIDQYDENHNGKYMTKRFEQLIQDIHKKPMAEQKQLIENTFNNWKGKSRQIDDVLIMGLKP